MPSRRKSFPCGHRGFGAFCHHCEQQRRLQARREAQRRATIEAHGADPIDLRGFPGPVVERTRAILRRLEAGVPWRDVQGRRLRSNRHIIRIPIGRDYRLLVRQSRGRPLVPLRLLSHEDYNNFRPAG